MGSPKAAQQMSNYPAEALRCPLPEGVAEQEATGVAARA